MSVQTEQLDSFVDLYDLLQISPRAHPDMVHTAYRELIKRYQSDGVENPHSARIVRHLNAAYAVLRDENRRARYDAYRLRDVTLADRSMQRPYIAAPAIERNEPVPEAPRSTRKAVAVCVAVMLGMLGIAMLTVDIFEDPSAVAATGGKVAGAHKRSLGDLIIDATRLTPGPCGPQFPGPMNPC